MWEIAAANPVFLWMLPLAALPILFHLFLRVRKQQRLFPSLMFFLQAEPRLSARKRIREWLILLLRVLLVALLLLALSRPLWQGHGGGGPVALALLIDNSGSMSGPAPDGRSKLANALDAASALIGSMGPQDTLALVPLVEDSAAALPEGLTPDKDALRAALGRIRGTHASGQPAAALIRSFTLLASASTSRREIHVLTDAQEAEWARPPRDVHTPPAGTTLCLHRLPSKPLDTPNAALGAIELPQRALLADRHYRASVTVNNLSDQEARVRLLVSDSGGGARSLPAEIPPRKSRVLGIPLETHAPGCGWVTVDLEGDGFEPDNHAAAAYTCAPRKTVLFCGPETGFGVVPLAVSPSGDGTLSGLVPVFKPVAVPLSSSLREAPVLLVIKGGARLTDPADALAVKHYLEQGGNVLVLPDPQEAAGALPFPAWIPVTSGKRVADEKGLRLRVLSPAETVWDDLRNEAGEVMLAPARVFRATPLGAPEGVAALLALPDGRPVLVRQRVGKGSLFISGVELDAQASTLPLKTAFVALIHGMALSGQAPPDDTTAGVAGERLALRQGAEYVIRSVTGGPFEWHGTGSKAPILARAGIYSLETGGATAYLAVRSAVDEGRSRFIESGPIPALAGMAVAVDVYRDGESLVERVKRVRSGIDLFLPLLLLALIAAVAEGWLVNPALPKPGKEQAGP